ncbi:CsbD family protein [Paraburkholderia ultramafica]|uniref:CsbD family protein n=1 Tax=Paraburkholderia ultramafica TaxID=1544867 RepID=UPI001FE7D5C3|nr:CsbD family protein [Paraburkholderia ultramafica]
MNETIGRATGDRKQEVPGDVQQAAGEKRQATSRKPSRTRPESPSEAGLRRAPVSRRVSAKHLNGDA